MISIRGNKKIAFLEKLCREAIPENEKISRSNLLELAVKKVSDGNADWKCAYDLLKSLRAAQYENLSVADFFQARLDKTTEAQYNDLKQQIAETCDLSRARNDFCWQMLLANLLVQTGHDDCSSYPRSAHAHNDTLVMASQANALHLISTLTRLLEMDQPEDADYATLAKISKLLGDWEADKHS